MERPLVVAYQNQRFVLMEQHEDCIEFRSRGEFMGEVWKHTALVYEEGDAWFVLKTSQLWNTPEVTTSTFAAKAFLDARGAMKHAAEWVTTAQGKRRAR